MVQPVSGMENLKLCVTFAIQAQRPPSLQLGVLLSVGVKIR